MRISKGEYLRAKEIVKKYKIQEKEESKEPLQFRPAELSDLKIGKTVYYNGERAEIVEVNKVQSGNLQVCLDIHHREVDDDESIFGGMTYYTHYFTNRPSMLESWYVYTELKILI